MSLQKPSGLSCVLRRTAYSRRRPSALVVDLTLGCGEGSILASYSTYRGSDHRRYCRAAASPGHAAHRPNRANTLLTMLLDFERPAIYVPNRNSTGGALVEGRYR
jgi:hypothetical protein